MALHLLQSDRKGGLALASALTDAMNNIQHCSRCQNFTEQTLCNICSDQERDQSTLCIVENPADVDLMELASGYMGTYFVLMGKLSPLDGIGPAELRMDKLFDVIRSSHVKEVILAVSTTIEGEATAHYIADQLVNDELIVSRIQSGVSASGQASNELDAVSGGTLKQALSQRTNVVMV
jgi:recombination protein RecR